MEQGDEDGNVEITTLVASGEVKEFVYFSPLTCTFCPVFLRSS